MRFALLLAALPFALGAPPGQKCVPVIQPPGATLIDGHYIIETNSDSHESIVKRHIKDKGKKATHTYKMKGFSGFSAQMSNAEIQNMACDPDVKSIEQDAEVKAYVGGPAKHAFVTQSPAPWGLARISHRSRGATSYTYDNSAGDGTCVYVIDTGIDISHPEFGGRARFLANFAGDNSITDGNGHGTHCAGTIGSKTYGVAKKTKLYAVKVLGAAGNGTNSGVIAGLDYVVKDVRTRNCPKGAVGSMSLGGLRSTALNKAAADVVAAGVFLAVAAGNENSNARCYSPASEPSVFTVGATDQEDRRASFSNFGEDVDMFAPGVNIISTWLNGGTAQISGTSMATPHVAGLAAYFLGLMGKKEPAELGSLLKERATSGSITNLPTRTSVCDSNKPKLILSPPICQKVPGLPTKPDPRDCTANTLAFNGNPSG